MVKETSPFLRSLIDVLTGAHVAESLVKIVVTEAVHDTLTRVSRDYFLDYSTLVDKYAKDVVDECCRLTETTARCSATTVRDNKQCVRRAVLGDLCAVHLWKNKRLRHGHGHDVLPREGRGGGGIVRVPMISVSSRDLALVL
jgi:hypothetical protein